MTSVTKSSFLMLDQFVVNDIFKLIPNDVATVSQLSREYLDIVRDSQRALLKGLDFHPIIHTYYQLSVFESKNPNEKLKILAQILGAGSNPGYNSREFSSLANMRNLSEIFIVACCLDDLKFVKDHTENFDLTPQETIEKGFIKAVEVGSLSIVKFLLPFLFSGRSMHVLTEQYHRNILCRAGNNKEIVQFLLNDNRCARWINVNFALETENKEVLELILRSGRPINTKFEENACLNRGAGDSPGLHRALMLAAQLDRFEMVNAILSNSNPSVQILEHVRDRVQWLKDHAEESVIFWEEQRHLNRDEFTVIAPYNRDAIIALLDQHIQRSTP